MPAKKPPVPCCKWYCHSPCCVPYRSSVRSRTHVAQTGRTSLQHTRYRTHPARFPVINKQQTLKVQGFLRRSIRVGFCSPDLSNFNEICTQADQNIFSKVLNNTDHVLHHLLTPVHNTSHSYSLRLRAHDRELPDRLTHLTDCNFIIRMLFYQVY